MSLQKREKVLAGGVGVLLLVTVFWTMGLGGGPSVGQLQQAVNDLETKIKSRTERIAAVEADEARIKDWKRRSLPPDEKMASSLYQNWLLRLADTVKLQGAKVESAGGQAHHGIYFRHGFTLRGQGSVEQLVRFLYEFYSSGSLHLIKHLDIKPVEKNVNSLDLTFNIEALSILNAEPRDTLSQEPPPPMAHAGLSDYLAKIMDRRLFAPYAPPAPVKGDSKPSTPFDVTRYAYLTAVLETDGRRGAWLRSRTTDQTFQLFEGDTFEIGPTKAKVVHIGQRDVDLEVDGSTFTVALGANLHDATTAAAKPAEKSDSPSGGSAPSTGPGTPSTPTGSGPAVSPSAARS